MGVTGKELALVPFAKSDAANAFCQPKIDSIHEPNADTKLGLMRAPFRV